MLERDVGLLQQRSRLAQSRGVLPGIADQVAEELFRLDPSQKRPSRAEARLDRDGLLEVAPGSFEIVEVESSASPDVEPLQLLRVAGHIRVEPGDGVLDLLPGGLRIPPRLVPALLRQDHLAPEQEQFPK